MAPLVACGETAPLIAIHFLIPMNGCPMKVFAVITVLLLLLIAYRIPSGLEIGEGMIQAEANRVAEIQREEQEKAAAMAAEQEKARAVEQQAAEEMRVSTAKKLQEQADFDALPKWDKSGNPINRVPPPGLDPTAEIGPRPPPPPRATPSPAEIAAEIERKFKAK